MATLKSNAEAGGMENLIKTVVLDIKDLAYVRDALVLKMASVQRSIRASHPTSPVFAAYQEEFNFLKRLMDKF